MFLLGIVVCAGTAAYCAITGDWPTSKYTIGPGIAFAVGVWMLFDPVRRFIFGDGKD